MLSITKNNLTQYDFKSSTIPEFDENLLFECQQILFKLKISDLQFFMFSFIQKESNINGNFWIFLKNYFYQDTQTNKFLLIDPQEIKNLSIGFIDKLFQYDELKIQYEGVYNTLNYIKNIIYKKIKANYRQKNKIEILLDDYYQNQIFLQSRCDIKEICEYLVSIKKSVKDSRSSIANRTIIATNKEKQKTSCLTVSQEQILNAAAFGCSNNELDAYNYESTKKLIYVPTKNKKNYKK